MVKEAMRKLSSQRAELEQRSKASSSEIQTKRHELKSLTATVEALGRELKAAEKSLA
jgi:chromosome segregation ATPase